MAIYPFGPRQVERQRQSLFPLLQQGKGNVKGKGFLPVWGKATAKAKAKAMARERPMAKTKTKAKANLKWEMKRIIALCSA